jgi:hypothetical protein
MDDASRGAPVRVIRVAADEAAAAADTPRVARTATNRGAQAQGLRLNSLLPYINRYSTP